MHITTQKVITYFFSLLEAKLKAENQHRVSPYFYDFFTRSEIMELIRFVHGDTASEKQHYQELHNDDLLDLVGSDSLILMYYLKKWQQQQHDATAITAYAVNHTLTQLGLCDHPLASKAIAFWDAQDHRMYQTLLLKAGKTQVVYGVLCHLTDDEITSELHAIPMRFYETQALAQQAIAEIKDRYDGDTPPNLSLITLQLPT